MLESFERVFNGDADAAAELAALRALALPGALADGYARRAAGHSALAA